MKHSAIPLLVLLGTYVSPEPAPAQFVVSDPAHSFVSNFQWVKDIAAYAAELDQWADQLKEKKREIEELGDLATTTANSVLSDISGIEDWVQQFIQNPLENNPIELLDDIGSIAEDLDGAAFLASNALGGIFGNPESFGREIGEFAIIGEDSDGDPIYSETPRDEQNYAMEAIILKSAENYIERRDEAREALKTVDEQIANAMKAIDAAKNQAEVEKASAVLAALQETRRGHYNTIRQAHRDLQVAQITKENRDDAKIRANAQDSVGIGTQVFSGAQGAGTDTDLSAEYGVSFGESMSVGALDELNYQPSE